ncbi:hypothetical protein ACHHYP_14007 [Achlya hypogyna]|uniref:Uncharacterized protein n=1 Tax=Achlya hypogyna TaxID=1202772 RepID=A0A1V9YE81_ACHHY|nr:hypothetical protein ACHHYP_14007 [Achlya hypogyna]
MDELPTSFGTTKKQPPTRAPRNKKPTTQTNRSQGPTGNQQRSKRPSSGRGSGKYGPHTGTETNRQPMQSASYGRSLFKDSFLEDPWAELLQPRDVRPSKAPTGFGRSLFQPSFLEDPWAALLAY